MIGRDRVQQSKFSKFTKVFTPTNSGLHWWIKNRLEGFCMWLMENFHEVIGDSRKFFRRFYIWFLKFRTNNQRYQIWISLSSMIYGLWWEKTPESTSTSVFTLLLHAQTYDIFCNFTNQGKILLQKIFGLNSSTWLWRPYFYENWFCNIALLSHILASSQKSQIARQQFASQFPNTWSWNHRFIWSWQCGKRSR